MISFNALIYTDWLCAYVIRDETISNIDICLFSFCHYNHLLLDVLVSPELSIQSSIISSTHILVNCTILARPLNSAKLKQNRFEINNIKRKQINDYTVELILLLDVS